MSQVAIKKTASRGSRKLVGFAQVGRNAVGVVVNVMGCAILLLKYECLSACTICAQTTQCTRNGTHNSTRSCWITLSIPRPSSKVTERKTERGHWPQPSRKEDCALQRGFEHDAYALHCLAEPLSSKGVEHHSCSPISKNIR